MPNKEKIDQLAKARIEQTTNHATAWGVKLFRGWLTENGFDETFEQFETTILNDRLSYFYASLQTRKGTDYSKSALVGIRAAISRHLTSPPYNRELNLMSDRVFMTSNHVLMGMIKTLKREGKDMTVHKKAVAEGDIEKLYTSGVFDTDKPSTLQNKVFWDVMINFGRRGQEGLHALKKSSYAKFSDDKGHTYYKMTYNEMDKTHHGIDSRENNKDVRMYASPEDVNCPVASFEFYLSKLSPKCESLFQQPLLRPKPTVWYAAQPIGKNKLSSMMARISAEAGLSCRYTNHCIRATVATGLKRAGVDNLTIMSVTGHRNQSSLESYVQGPSEAQRRKLSKDIQSLATGTSAIDSDISISNSMMVARSQTVVASSRSSGTASTAPNSEVVSERSDSLAHVQSKSVNVNASLRRNPLADMNLLTNANITGGTFTFNIVNKE